jgi:putative ABC transport system substrate-binding protein
MINVSDPVGSGLIASLARPGGNVTGSSDFGTEIAEKAVEMLHTVAPKATRIAVLMSDNPVHPSQLRVIQDAARKIGLAVLPTMVRTDNEFETAFASMGKQGAGAFVLLGGAPFSTDRQVARILELAANTRLPAAYPGRYWVQAGGLLSYGSSFLYRWQLTASYVAKILKGARPSELPVQQPAEVELWINLKTAKALGLTIPPSLLQRADQVIE